MCWQLFSFNTLKMSFTVSDLQFPKKSTVIHITVFSTCSVSFFFQTDPKIFLIFNFQHFTICVGKVFFQVFFVLFLFVCFLHLGFHRTSWIFKFMCFVKSGKFSAIISSNIFFYSNLFLLSGAPITQMFYFLARSNSPWDCSFLIMFLCLFFGFNIFYWSVFKVQWFFLLSYPSSIEPINWVFYMLL